MQTRLVSATKFVECKHIEGHKFDQKDIPERMPLEATQSDLERQMILRPTRGDKIYVIVTTEIGQEHLWIPQALQFKEDSLQKLFAEFSPKDPFIEQIPLADHFYESGMKLYQDEKNFSKLKMAADLGHGRAQYEMFLILATQKKLESRREGGHYLHCSAAQGFLEALLDLCDVYLGSFRVDVKKDVNLAKMLCQAAADLHSPQAQHMLEVVTLTEGLFNTEINFQAGVRKAQELSSSNPFSRKFINSIKNMPEDTLEELYLVTEEDVEYLETHTGRKRADS